MRQRATLTRYGSVFTQGIFVGGSSAPDLPLSAEQVGAAGVSATATLAGKAAGRPVPEELL